MLNANTPLTSGTYRVNGRALPAADRLMTGRQIRTDAGFDPASEYSLVLIIDRGTRSIGLDEMVEIDPTGATELRVFESDRIFSFTVDERGYEWGAARIEVAELHRITGLRDGYELILDGEEDVVLISGSILDLSGRGAERVRSRLARPKTVTIIVNGRERQVERGPISYERIVELAFGSSASAVTHTVNWRTRDGDEGSLLPGQTVKAREGMIFTATATNRS